MARALCTCLLVELVALLNAEFVSEAPSEVRRRIKVIERSWLSHRIQTSLVKFISEELYNVTVVRVPEHVYADRDGIMKAVASWDLDYDAESWLTADQFRDYVLEKKTVLNPGPVGYAGQSGLFYPGFVDTLPAATGLYTDWYKAHRENPDVVRLFPEEKDVNLTAPYACDNFWCEQGRWSPVHCRNNDCRVIYHQREGYDEAVLESLVNSHKLNYSVAFLGDDFVKIIQERIAAGQPTLLYHWTPHPLIEQWQLQRVTFPSYRTGCSSSAGGPSSLRLCDFQPTPLQKIASRRLRQASPMLYKALMNMDISEKTIGAIMAATAGKGSVDQVVKAWAMQNIKLLRSWMPQCSLDAFDATDLVCREDTSYLRAEHAAKELIRDVLRGSKLKVMTVIDEPFVFADNTSDELTYTGFLPDLLSELAMEAEFFFDWVEPAAGSQRRYDNVFDQVVNGSADMIFAAHFNTWERSVQLKFTAPYMEGGIGMMSYRVPPTFMQKMYTPFEPFTGEVWATVSVLAIGTAVLSYVLDRWRLKMKGQLDAVKMPSFSTHLYLSIVGQGEPKTKGSRLILFAYMMLLTIFLAAYTANLAAFLSKSPASDALESVADVEEQPDGSVCTLLGSAIAHLTRQRFPNLEQVTSTQQKSGLDKMKASECVGFVYDMPILSWRSSQDCNTYVGANSEFNKLNYVGGFSHFSAYQDMLPALDFFILKLRQEGFIDKLYDKHFRSVEKCNRVETQELGMQHMSGAVAAFCALVAISLVGEAAGSCFKHFACFMVKNVTGLSHEQIVEAHEEVLKNVGQALNQRVEVLKPNMRRKSTAAAGLLRSPNLTDELEVQLNEPPTELLQQERSSSDCVRGAEQQPGGAEEERQAREAAETPESEVGSGNLSSGRRSVPPSPAEAKEASRPEAQARLLEGREDTISDIWRPTYDEQKMVASEGSTEQGVGRPPCQEVAGFIKSAALRAELQHQLLSRDRASSPCSADASDATRDATHGYIQCQDDSPAPHRAVLQL
eukprot:TRINITY_DN20252_c0_g1_i2.p1 TRINITY_DN20252_c0_g1~~TRINITY_DN20252_c0_g1_i2.p1  ORF type:complete len:1011 (-),score=187.43 TRINITY_DN20252_c0_g1_i2:85-3117(-)